ncbi:hypothetical protein [Sediminibacterium soli]|uniref:hypothetical protein n=1 Tax=Sediminibacterium soli TaxID=2698829 RepID=UPI00137A0A8D|nr:hypothetical protein [Sediminibacterium soli]NCI47415.1 hypothetical protein [Sediminibacterium soli]
MRLQKFVLIPVIALCAFVLSPKEWSSGFVQQLADGSLRYTPDEKGNTIPDFSGVGYCGGDKEIPFVAVVKTISPATSGSSEELIEAAVAEVAKLPADANGFRGAILLKKGTYYIPESVNIQASGVVLRGEGDNIEGTRILATAKKQVAAFAAAGTGSITEVQGTRTRITDDYVPVGARSFHISNASVYKTGDRIILFRPGTAAWIRDLQMDRIEERDGTRQWQPKEYNLQFERVITGIDGNTILIDNPVVLAMETKYGGGEIFKYSFPGRISQVGIENMYFESAYASDTAEDHGWDAIKFDNLENGWIRNVTARYFGYSCVNLEDGAKNISVLNANCFDHKSIITGGRRYSFNNTGQLNLFANCHATDGRHDFVTGARVCGPNVFVNCTAKRTHADIGPHHRWAVGTLFDNIVTDGELNIQDRGNWGSGHGWAGVTQVMWNCTVKRAAVQSPWVNGKNYSIGTKGQKYEGRLKNRPDGEWEGLNAEELKPKSLYYAQLKARAMQPR